MLPAAPIATVTFPPVAAFAWLLTPFLGAALVACVYPLRTAVGSHLRRCLATGWLGLTGLVWGATSLDTAAGELVFLVGGPLGGLSVWSRSSGGDGPGDGPPPDDDGDPPEWDWERFERDLLDYEARRALPRP